MVIENQLHFFQLVASSETTSYDFLDLLVDPYIQVRSLVEVCVYVYYILVEVFVFL